MKYVKRGALAERKSGDIKRESRVSFLLKLRSTRLWVKRGNGVVGVMGGRERFLGFFTVCTGCCDENDGKEELRVSNRRSRGKEERRRGKGEGKMYTWMSRQQNISL